MKKTLSLSQYISIFNFLSKVIYYSTDDDVSPLSMKRIKRNELIPRYDILNSMKNYIKSCYKKCTVVNFINLYNTRIDDEIVISVIDCDMEFDNKSNYTYLRPFTFFNNCFFSDDQIHIFVFVDKDFYSGIDFEADTGECPTESNYEYFGKMLAAIISIFANNNELSRYTKLVSGILYNDGDITDNEAKIIDKILKEVCEINIDYIKIDIQSLGNFREILDDYLEETKYKYSIAIDKSLISLYKIDKK